MYRNCNQRVSATLNIIYDSLMFGCACGTLTVLIGHPDRKNVI